MFGKSIIVFGVDSSSSIHVNNQKKDILILGKGPTDGLGDNKIIGKAEYFHDFTVSKNLFCV